MTCLNVSIHSPGLGKKRSSSGYTPTSTYGLAMPTPRLAKTASVIVIGWSTAQATAVAMNGAVHGVASTVVTTPLKNAPSGPFLRGGRLHSAAAEEAGIGTSHTPSRLSAIANTTAAIVTLNAVLPNWPPQRH